MSKSGSPSRKTIETAVSFKMLIFILYFRYLYPYSSCFIGFSLCVKQVNLVLDDGRSLGLMIRGGAEYALGIYITGVDQGSAAECGGLKVLLQFHFSLTTLFYIVYLTYVLWHSYLYFGIHMRRLASYLKSFQYAPPPHGFHAKNTCCMPKVSLYCFTVHLTVLILRYEEIASLYGLFEIVHYKCKSTCRLHLQLPLLSSGSARFAIR